MKPRIVVVEEGNVRYVVQTDEEKGYIIDTQGNKSEEMNMQTLIKGGYWKDYDGDLKPADLIK